MQLLMENLIWPEIWVPHVKFTKIFAELLSSMFVSIQSAHSAERVIDAS